ncbi:unnamed protein product [Hermetia illucens]|uniref:Endonuclease/exonuclease/phosphatase domain-containing protein n=1 Tax=Hermetia illucens TaxID=343691 RepID=A0A7R8UV03_HERIL|nr:unnamed protein product [Hermetia illucens]
MMIGLSHRPRRNARASTSVDAAGRAPVLSRNGQGFLTHGRRQDVSKLVRTQRTKQTRVCTLNVGTLTGKTEELARALRKRCIDICALQETRWSGAKSCDIERERGKNGYKLLYFGNPHTQYGVDIAISEGFRDAIKEVKRFDDRLMKLTIISADRTIHFFTAYAPQTGRPDAEKDAFWQLLDEKTCHVPADDYIIIAGDLNGHVGEKADGNRCHGGKGFGARNEGGERIIDFADTHDLVLMNTWFIKRLSHLPTFYSGNNKTQIDYILIRRQHFTTVTDCKVVPYETIAPQHRPLISVLRIKPPIKQREERTGPPRIKWWRFGEKNEETITNVEESWNQMKDTIHKAPLQPSGSPSRVREKKRLYHKFLDDKTPANWQIYKNANREAKKAVAVTRANHFKSLYDELDTRDGERDLYRLAKSRDERTQDIEHFCCVNDKNGTLLTDRRAAKDRWREYFEQISTEEFAHPPLPQSLPTFGAVLPVSVSRGGNKTNEVGESNRT